MDERITAAGYRRLAGLEAAAVDPARPAGARPGGVGRGGDPGPLGRVPRQAPEADLQQKVCDYLRLRYPGVLFHSDYAAGIKLTMGQAVRRRRMESGRAWPDLFVAEPRGAYHGLFIELKKEGARIHLKDGSMTKDEHVREQAAVLERLRERGYEAGFGIGFDMCRSIIDKYLSHA